MAKIRSGILGNTRGKVAGVVASQWKDVNYIREYVKPGNPQTAGQVAQRTKMALAVEFVRPIVGPILNRFQDPFLKSVSGYNQFISDNISKFVDPVPYTTVSVTTGKLLPLASFASVTPAAVAIKDFTWDDTKIPAGLENESVQLAVYNESQKVWYFGLDGELLGAGAGDVDCTGQDAADTLTAYGFYGQYIDNILREVAPSVSIELV